MSFLLFLLSKQYIVWPLRLLDQQPKRVEEIKQLNCLDIWQKKTVFNGQYINSAFCITEKFSLTFGPTTDAWSCLPSFRSAVQVDDPFWPTLT